MARRNRRRHAKKVLKLTRHFCEKWAERYGREPQAQEIESLMREAALAQESRRMAYPNGTPWKPLAIYIHFRMNVCIMVDETEKGVSRAVTLLTDEDQMRAKMEAGRRRAEVTPLRVVAGRDTR